MNKDDEFGQSFLKLGLEINKHINGYMDSYFGPKDLEKEVESTKSLPPGQLLTYYQELEDKIPTEDPNRNKYLIGTVKSMGFLIRKLNGTELEYLDEVEGLFSISPELISEDVFLNAHKTLDDKIPGKGPLAERIIKRNHELNIPAKELPRAVDMILNEVRNRSSNIFHYNSKESVEIEYVKDEFWSMDCHYLGNYRSLIKINLDIDWNPLMLTAILIHETFPGHHTEFQTKENKLYEEMGYAEEACFLLLSPKAIISEGIANTAIEIISPGLEIYEWISDVLMPDLNIPESKPSELYHMDKDFIALRNCRTNAAIMLNSGKISKEEAIDYVKTYGLVDYKSAERSINFATDPLYRTYVFTYTEGYRLINQAVQGNSKLPLFKRLISEQFLPEDLKFTT
jgi:hypothetical protein